MGLPRKLQSNNEEGELTFPAKPVKESEWDTTPAVWINRRDLAAVQKYLFEGLVLASWENTLFFFGGGWGGGCAREDFGCWKCLSRLPYVLSAPLENRMSYLGDLGRVSWILCHAQVPI